MKFSWFASSTEDTEPTESPVLVDVKGLSPDDYITTLPKFMAFAARLGLGGPEALHTYNLDSNLYQKINEGAQFHVYRRTEWHESGGQVLFGGYTRNLHKVYKRISRALYRTESKDSLRDLRLEIQVLAQDVVRAHPNIADLVGWGYDYPRQMCEERRTASDRYPFNQSIPVLIIGEAYCSLDIFFTTPVFKQSEVSSWATRCHLALGIAAGLECLREIGVLHNDLKPENILVCRQDDPEMPFVSKLNDFGLSATSVDGFRSYGRTIGWKPPESSDYDEQKHGTCSREALFKSESYVYGLVVLYIICEGQEPLQEYQASNSRPYPQWRRDRWAREKETVDLIKRQTKFSDTDMEQARSCYHTVENNFLLDMPLDRKNVSPRLLLGDSLHYQHWFSYYERHRLAIAGNLPFVTWDNFYTGLSFYRSLNPRILEDLKAYSPSDFSGDLLFSMAMGSLATRMLKDHAYIRDLITMSVRTSSPSLIGMGVASNVSAAIPGQEDPWKPGEMKEYLRKAVASGSRVVVRELQSMSSELVQEAQSEFRSTGGYNHESWFVQEYADMSVDIELQLLAAQKDWHTQDIPPLMDEMRKRRNGLLHIASMLGSANLIRILVGSGHDINALNFAGETPLYKACSAGQFDSAVTLMDLGADATILAGPLKVSCLHWVFAFSDHQIEPITRRLLAKGLIIDARVLPTRETNEHDWVQSRHFPFHWPIGTPLHWAAHAESSIAVDALLRCGAQVDELDMVNDERAQTALAMAVFRGSVDMALHLVQRGASAARIDGRGSSMLHLLVVNQTLYNTLIPVPKVMFQWCLQGSYENVLRDTRKLVKMITDAGININFNRRVYKTDEWCTPLQDAINNKDAVGVLVLLEAGADPNVIEKYSGQLPLHAWASTNIRYLAYPAAYLAALELLVTGTRDWKARDLDGETCIQSALPGVDAPNEADFQVWKRKLKLLLRHAEKPCIDDRDKRGKTLLLHAVCYRNIPCWSPLGAVEYLRSLGADITATDENGSNFLWHISRRNDLREEVIITATDLWLDLFPDVDNATLLNESRNKKTGETYLVHISENGLAKCVRSALKHGANTNLTNSQGLTALDNAVVAGNRSRLNAMTQFHKHFDKMPSASEEYHEDIFQDQIYDGGSGEGYLDRDASRSDNQKRYFALPEIRDLLISAGGKTGKQLGTAKYAPDVKTSEEDSLEAIGVWDGFRRNDQPYFEIWRASYDLDDD
ncbi:unnamed protein product [Periconia digitata]|uniref:Protein kinase domain-containing protein n=1 Tax=Periconia digitata TaxID=1303443 RepID=A0A9W4U6T8_9PLEO|nr:unnamed protein product [Periconia digitata]